MTVRGLQTQLDEANQVIEELAQALSQFIEAPFTDKTNRAMNSYLTYRQHHPKEQRDPSNSRRGKKT